MRPQKVLSAEILAGLTKVFRSKGYEGASLNDLAEATGLKKASLYHRFPNGKQEMAEAVLDHIGEWVENNVFAALTNDKDAPSVRLKKGLYQIKSLYNRGEESCILRALSMEAGLALFDTHIHNGMMQWIDVFEKVGGALGFSKTTSRARAVQTLVEVQGSLVVSRGMNDVKVFEDTLRKIESDYLNN